MVEGSRLSGMEHDKEEAQYVVCNGQYVRHLKVPECAFEDKPPCIADCDVVRQINRRKNRCL